MANTDYGLAPLRPVVLSGPHGMPAQPHLHDVKRSREAGDLPSPSPEARTDLHQILNAERWSHHKILHYMDEERQRLFVHVENQRKESEAWAIAWHTANSELLRCHAMRIEQTKKLQELRREVHDLRMNEMRSPVSHDMILDMSAAKERRMQVLRRRVRRQGSEYVS
ncbi:hypothetical protein LTR53_017440 [Teratosphaeriaceae sp. CCFEE 6253]|nr:hypothetical protein LTR53_017440 [Teratosphaeriaceae sp. CCFEE 6253]